MIAKAGKGNTSVVIRKDEHNGKDLDFIDDSKFTYLSKDPTSGFGKLANNILSNCKSLSKTEQNRLKMINPKAPILKGLLKIHKIGNLIRPVVDFRSEPTYRICQYLNKKLKNSIQWNNKYSLNNTYELVKNIKDIQIPNNSLFLSFDIKNMYSNIDTQRQFITKSQSK